ncbi:unnamed protein product [Closterium sp. Naga37s-1]|nr:unnamed protein product [Closterium sp. Naga37s-1]
MRASLPPTCLLLLLLLAIALTTPLHTTTVAAAAGKGECWREKRDLEECRAVEKVAAEQKEAMERKANETEEAAHKERDTMFDCKEKVDQDNLAWHNEKSEITARIATLDKTAKELEEQVNAMNREL